MNYRLGITVLLLISSNTASADDMFFGICDASAAVALDGERFAVADDETNVLSIYRWTEPHARETVDLTDFLDNRKSDGDVREADIEAVARIGDRLYWITSHGRGSDGDVKKGRHRLFTTHVSADGRLEPAAKPYTGLLSAMVAEPQYAELGLEGAAQKAPKEPGGFNIEGMAASPSGELLIGLRNPLADGHALVIPLLNPAEVVAGTQEPRFGDHETVDLGGLGIRSMEGTGDGYVIVAGSVGESDATEAAALRTWRGPGHGSDTELLRELPAGFNGEAVMQMGMGGEQKFVVLSDDGNETVDGVACKKTSVPVQEKRFRWLAIDPA